MNMKKILLSLSLFSLGSGSLARASDLTIDAHSKYSGYSWSELGIKTLIVTAKKDFTAVGHEDLHSYVNSAFLNASTCNYNQIGIVNISRGTSTKYQFGIEHQYSNRYVLTLQPVPGSIENARVISCQFTSTRSSSELFSLDDISALLEQVFTVQGIGTLN